MQELILKAEYSKLTKQKFNTGANNKQRMQSSTRICEQKCASGFVWWDKGDDLETWTEDVGSERQVLTNYYRKEMNKWWKEDFEKPYDVQLQELE